MNMSESTNNQNEIKKSLNVFSWIKLLLGLFLVISIFFPYGLGTYFFSKLLVFICGLVAMLDVIPNQDQSFKSLKLYGLYIFIKCFFCYNYLMYLIILFLYYHQSTCIYFLLNKISHLILYSLP